jgi:hypothetical protein
MPNYNPKDMAMMLQISKKGAMTPQEQALMQNINTAMQPEIAAGNVGMMPQVMPGSMSNADMAAMQRQATPAAMVGSLSNADIAAMKKQAMPQPMNRLAQIQAAANQVLAGGENPEGQRMANVARYFQGR